MSSPGNPPPPPTHPSQQPAYQPPTPALSQSSYNNRQSPNPNSLSPPITTNPYGPPPSSIPGQPGLSNAPAQSSYPPISSRVDGNPYASTQAQNSADTTPQPPTSPGVDRARRSSLGSFNDGRNGGNRPTGSSSYPTATNESTPEKAWGTLFDEDLPTSRMGQLLRGIALHMV